MVPRDFFPMSDPSPWDQCKPTACLGVLRFASLSPAAITVRKTPRNRFSGFRNPRHISRNPARKTGPASAEADAAADAAMRPAKVQDRRKRLCDGAEKKLKRH
ncbi:MAG: hypothetical protein LBU18_00235 [Treponema sp.]|nr:hypothetical protein [Treponema sp.]